eukprot:CAMPEP_0194273346 /NCGR_PEP_ID=MMETSP0169-20130528/6696_1 /TAXON_ID=218684 /ORGANISM="Corethron pennatum, Strain L29A3" /LENGTH=34 /DNA_ID= /DNA_START= /DNA_END= /DNA_ORIENTATION=
MERERIIRDNTAVQIVTDEYIMAKMVGPASIDPV